MVLLLILNSVVDVAVDIILVSGSDFDFDYLSTATAVAAAVAAASAVSVVIPAVCVPPTRTCPPPNDISNPSGKFHFWYNQWSNG
mmetsp:Transcript_63419/g.71783  ORF Transcript_63419/g.71783 Transcript_63419/m.71783 type:complete len:85 (+) Transcript_63419:1255-1509(+)